MTHVVFRILNDVLYATCKSHASYFSWQAQYLVWTITAVAMRIVNDVSYVTRINDDSYYSWQAQYLVMLEADTCPSPHCK